MNLSIIFGLLGGLSLFLYGMHMMSGGLEDIAGNRMKQILEKITSNRILGVVVGTVITAIIQSSSATTVMVVGFVNSGLMTLKQAVWIIMGANIGTTVTSQFIALDVGVAAPIFAFVGVAMIVFFKSQKLHNFGKIVAGLGILFLGMNMMSESMFPLRESSEFVSLMTRFSNPFLGIVTGAIFTAIIQSSSASVGILQALAVAGVVNFNSAIYILFGQNIGTCITAAIASIGTNKEAKRTALIHFVFNIIGATIFTTLSLLTPFIEWMKITSPNVSSQIANTHTLFSVVTTILLLPFGNYLVLIVKKILPDKANENVSTNKLYELSTKINKGRSNLGTIAVHTELLDQEIKHMMLLSKENTNKAFSSILEKEISVFSEIANTEKEIDRINKEITQYISKILVRNNNKKNVAAIEQYFLITGNIERIGDHAINISEYAEEIKRNSVVFSSSARTELLYMKKIVMEGFSKILSYSVSDKNTFSELLQIEQKIDELTKQYRQKHLKRMQKGKCSEEACILYSQILTDFERIGDHILNIAQAYSKISTLQ